MAFLARSAGFCRDHRSYSLRWEPGRLRSRLCRSLGRGPGVLRGERGPGVWRAPRAGLGFEHGRAGEERGRRGGAEEPGGLPESERFLPAEAAGPGRDSAGTRPRRRRRRRRSPARPEEAPPPLRECEPGPARAGSSGRWGARGTAAPRRRAVQAAPGARPPGVSSSARGRRSESRPPARAPPPPACDAREQCPPGPCRSPGSSRRRGRAGRSRPGRGRGAGAPREAA
ncbi:uncharacterized protein LOC144332671 [Macaca mulatta]